MKKLTNPNFVFLLTQQHIKYFMTLWREVSSQPKITFISLTLYLFDNIYFNNIYFFIFWTWLKPETCHAPCYEKEI